MHENGIVNFFKLCTCICVNICVLE